MGAGGLHGAGWVHGMGVGRGGVLGGVRMMQDAGMGTWRGCGVQGGRMGAQKRCRVQDGCRGCGVGARKGCRRGAGWVHAGGPGCTKDRQGGDGLCKGVMCARRVQGGHTGVQAVGMGAGGLQPPSPGAPPVPHSVASPEGRVPTGSSTLTYEVVLGEYDMSIAEGPEQRIPVASSDIFVHPKWRSSCVACG